MAKTQRHEVDLLGTNVTYGVHHSDRATKSRIDVDIHGVTVVLPGDDDTNPETLLKENATWVLEKLETYDAHRERAPKRTFEAGANFPYLGEQRELIIEPRPSHTVNDESIRLRQSTVEQSSVKQVLENFYRRRAREYFTDCADDYAAQMGVKYEKIELRNQRTRWGSCSTDGTLSLNWRLVMAPPEVVEYIIVHELTHLIEQSHNREFWSLVREHDPDYKTHAQWLERNSTKLIFDDADL